MQQCQTVYDATRFIRRLLSALESHDLTRYCHAVRASRFERTHGAHALHTLVHLEGKRKGECCTKMSIGR